MGQDLGIQAHVSEGRIAVSMSRLGGNRIAEGLRAAALPSAAHCLR